MKNVFALLVSSGKKYTLHSVHKTETAAKEWEECKKYEGQECCIIEFTEEDVELMTEKLT